MNAATRAMNAQASSLQRIAPLKLTREGLWVILLVAGLFLSAFSIVYAKDLTRRLFIQEQGIKRQTIADTERWSKLLLERSTLTSAARIQHISQQQLGMVRPNAHHMQLVTMAKSED